MIMERLKAGASFADVAMDYSEDAESAQHAGVNERGECKAKRFDKQNQVRALHG